MGSQTDLLEIIAAGHSASGFPRRLDSRQKKPDQNPDNCDNYKQFHEGETAFLICSFHCSSIPRKTCDTTKLMKQRL
jgi:hypothetical protein